MTLGQAIANLKTLDQFSYSPKKFVCKICKIDYIDQFNMDNHNCYQPKISSYQCAKCNKCYTSKLALRKHQNRANDCASDAPKAVYSCSVADCKSFYYSKRSLINHYDRVHQMKMKNSLCQICNKSFLNDKGLKIHTMRMHQN